LSLAAPPAGTSRFLEPSLLLPCEERSRVFRGDDRGGPDLLGVTRRRAGAQHRVSDADARDRGAQLRGNVPVPGARFRATATGRVDRRSAVRVFRAAREPAEPSAALAALLVDRLPVRPAAPVRSGRSAAIRRWAA